MNCRQPFADILFSHILNCDLECYCVWAVQYELLPVRLIDSYRQRQRDRWQSFVWFTVIVTRLHCFIYCWSRSACSRVQPSARPHKQTHLCHDKEGDAEKPSVHNRHFPFSRSWVTADGFPLSLNRRANTLMALHAAIAPTKQSWDFIINIFFTHPFRTSECEFGPAGIEIQTQHLTVSISC